MGDRVFDEFDKGDAAFFVVLMTHRRSYQDHQLDKDVIIGTVREGGMFGEMALIDNGRRLASARAVDGDAFRLMVISHDLFKQKLSNLAPFQRSADKSAVGQCSLRCRYAIDRNAGVVDFSLLPRADIN